LIYKRNCKKYVFGEKTYFLLYYIGNYNIYVVISGITKLLP